MPANRDDLNVVLLKSFRIIYGSVRKHFRQVQQSCGISGSQLWILHELRNARGIGVSELADKLAIHQSTCSQLVEKLVGSGYVTKARLTTDQRRVGLSISTLGKRVLARAPGPAEGVLAEAIAELRKAEAQTLCKDLVLLINHLDVKDESAGQTHLSDL